jgi:hypothetical protein
LIFYGNQFIGGFKDLQLKLTKDREFSFLQKISDVSHDAESRKALAMNLSESSFVTVGLLDEANEFESVHEIKIELFVKDLPESCAAFLNLSKGSAQGTRS